MIPREVLSPEEIALSDVSFWLRPLEEREGGFRSLRRDLPISFHEESEVPPGMPFPRGPGFWALVKHEDILHVSRNPELFVSGKGSTIGDMPEQLLEYMGSIINMDKPRHTRLRKIISRGFTPSMIARAEASVERAVSTIMRNVSEKGECEFVSEIAGRLPLVIICDMMGIPESQYDFVSEQANVIIGAGSGDPDFVSDVSQLMPRLMGAVTSVGELCKEIAIARRAKPTDDLTSALVNAEIDGETLSDEELVSFFILLSVAGNETTRNAICHGLIALRDYPEQRALWQNDFEALAPTAVDEIVRWATPVIHFRRTATQDTEIRGQKIREGDKLVMWYNSANRDEDVFDEPYRFDLTRNPNPHIAFGGPGPHFCLGAHLARREVTVMFRELFKHMPDIQVQGEPRKLQSNFIHGIKKMQCEFTPSKVS
jgi:cytochrome P450